MTEAVATTRYQLRASHLEANCIFSTLLFIIVHRRIVHQPDRADFDLLRELPPCPSPSRPGPHPGHLIRLSDSVHQAGGSPVQVWRGKWRLAVSSTSQIYVGLLGEGIDAWRPVQAEHLSGNVYRIVPQKCDREIETWEFEPGDRVVCEHIESSDGRILAATKRATRSEGKER